MFDNLGIADKNPSPVRWFVSTGISGASLLAGRNADSFRVRYFFVGVSDSLKNLALYRLLLARVRKEIVNRWHWVFNRRVEHSILSHEMHLPVAPLHRLQSLASSGPKQHVSKSCIRPYTDRDKFELARNGDRAELQFLDGKRALLQASRSLDATQSRRCQRKPSTC